jgi:hypothetical protein
VNHCLDKDTSTSSIHTPELVRGVPRSPSLDSSDYDSETSMEGDAAPDQKLGRSSTEDIQLEKMKERVYSHETMLSALKNLLLTLRNAAKLTYTKFIDTSVFNLYYRKAWINNESSIVRHERLSVTKRTLATRSLK